MTNTRVAFRRKGKLGKANGLWNYSVQPTHPLPRRDTNVQRRKDTAKS